MQVQHRESVEKGTGTVLNPILFDSTKQSDLTQQIICQKCTISNQSYHGLNNNFSHFVITTLLLWFDVLFLSPSTDRWIYWTTG